MLALGDETLSYECERKAVKRLNLRVRGDGSIYVSAPMRMPLVTIEAFLTEKADWLREARARMLAHVKTAFLPQSGASLPLEGVEHTLLPVKGRGAAVRQNGKLLLPVSNPADFAAVMRALRRFVKSEAKRVLTARARQIYPHFAHRVPTFPQLTFRWMSSRWGSCTAAKNHITLNEKLLFVDPALADYVIVHEFCHFEHQDHSPAFYRYLSGFYPNYAAARRALSAAAIPEIAIEE